MMKWINEYRLIQNGEEIFCGRAVDIGDRINATRMQVVSSADKYRPLATSVGTFRIERTGRKIPGRYKSDKAKSLYGETKKETPEQRSTRIKKQRKQMAKVLEMAKKNKVSYGYQSAKLEGWI